MTGTPIETTRRRAVKPLVVGLVAVVLACVYVSSDLSRVDWDATHSRRSAKTPPRSVLTQRNDSEK